MFVGGERTDAGGIGIRTSFLRGSRLQGVRTSHSEMRQRSRPAVPDDAAVCSPQRLKTAIDFAALTARLKPRPFKTRSRTEFFLYRLIWWASSMDLKWKFL